MFAVKLKFSRHLHRALEQVFGQINQTTIDTKEKTFLSTKLNKLIEYHHYGGRKVNTHEWRWRCDDVCSYAPGPLSLFVPQTSKHSVSANCCRGFARKCPLNGWPKHFFSMTTLQTTASSPRWPTSFPTVTLFVWLSFASLVQHINCRLTNKQIEKKKKHWSEVLI